MKICGTIVTYNPDIDILSQNITTLSKQVQSIIIVDNGSKNTIELKELLREYKKHNLYLILNVKNIGLARGLNQSFEYAHSKSFEWNITMDQDSVLCDDFSSSCMKFLYENSSEDIGIISPQIIDINSYKDVKIEQVDLVEEVICSITSGSFTNVNAVIEVGGFDEMMFIDQIDYDIAFKLRMRGYKVYKNYSGLLKHQLGSITNHKLLGKAYLSIRNQGFRLMVRPMKILLVEKGKFSKIKMMFKGLFDSRKMIKELNR